jgi:hypothetical protein
LIFEKKDCSLVLMITEELVAYVKQQRQAGVADQAIREAILSVGWTEEDANQVLSSSSAPSSASAQTSPSPSQEPTTSVSQETEPVKTSQEVQKEVVREDLSASHPQEAATSSEIPPLDSQPGPIELDEQARPVTSASTSQKQESPLKTEEDLAKPVSFTNKGQQDQPKKEASQPAQAPVLDQEPEPNKERPMEIKIEQKDKSPSPIAGKQSLNQPVQTPKQEERPQVAVDPKAEEE